MDPPIYALVGGSDVALSDLSAPWLVARGVHESHQRPVVQSDAVAPRPVSPCFANARLSRRLLLLNTCAAQLVDPGSVPAQKAVDREGVPLQLGGERSAAWLRCHPVGLAHSLQRITSLAILWPRWYRDAMVLVTAPAPDSSSVPSSGPTGHSKQGPLLSRG